MLTLNDLEVVVYEGMIREKPASKEEARQFIKGIFHASGMISKCLKFMVLSVLPMHVTGYSGGYAETVSSVHVANLNTGFRKGEWDKVEV